jgi:hypothetical protein
MGVYVAWNSPCVYKSPEGTGTPQAACHVESLKLIPVLNPLAPMNASSEQEPYLWSCMDIAQGNIGYVSSFSTSRICGPLKLDGNISYQEAASTKEHSRLLASEPFPDHVSGKGSLMRGSEDSGQNSPIR